MNWLMEFVTCEMGIKQQVAMDHFWRALATMIALWRSAMGLQVLRASTLMLPCLCLLNLQPPLDGSGVGHPPGAHDFCGIPLFRFVHMSVVCSLCIFYICLPHIVHMFRVAGT